MSDPFHSVEALAPPDYSKDENLSFEEFAAREFKEIEDRLKGILSLAAQPYKPDYQQAVSILANDAKDRVEVLQSTMAKLVAELKATTAAPEVVQHSGLSEDQEKAWAKLSLWVFTKDPYFILKGYAGTGKTYLMKKLRDLPMTIYFSAPTNKATGVLSEALGIKARTVFSLLGLKMEQKEGELVMEYGKKMAYFPEGAILVVDEASMVNKKLCAFIEKARAEFKFKVLYVGDPAQLPPVGEKISRAWRMAEHKDCMAMLKKVMRYDNQILALSVRIREAMKRKDFRSPIIDDHSDSEGVWLHPSRKKFEASFLQFTNPSDFTDRKVIAWRNKTVDRYNAMIRASFGFTEQYHPGDLIMIASPIMDEDKTIIANTDDEFLVVGVKTGVIPISEKKNVPVFLLTVENREQSLLLKVPVDQAELEGLLATKASIAGSYSGKLRKEAWREYWELRDKFHLVRYSYALTAHRMQGTTTNTVFVDQTDILVNKNKMEAFRCLMVAATRPTTQLHTY